MRVPFCRTSLDRSSRIFAILIIASCLTGNKMQAFGQDLKDTARHNNPDRKHLFFKKFAVPVSLIALGIYGISDNNFINHDEIREERNEYFPGFSNKLDNYFQFAPIAAVYTMDALGKKGIHDWKQQSILLCRAQLIMMGIVVPLKKFTHIIRPDSSAYNSFPSGHTAQAFLGATFFYKEFGKSHPWETVGMFTIATGIGIFRVLNNKHWISDVLAGTGFGILSVELSYLLQKEKKKSGKGSSMMIMPTYNNGAIACTAIIKIN